MCFCLMFSVGKNFALVDSLKPPYLVKFKLSLRVVIETDVNSLADCKLH
uniref:Uncharacterized protein n=1 Tax=Arundo donax TaxID=35708 RepID=A0A0A8YUU7_ARUDO